MTTQQTPQKRRITVIPPNPQLTERDIHKKHLRVAPYCRVSTDSEEQLNSYNAQIAYYTEKIAATPEWTMVRLYADEGITGTSMKRRKEFLKMLRDCDRGKIDLIITKSVSRFGRNTLDGLDTVRKLKRKGIGVFFEKENTNTLYMDNEMILTFMMSQAQAESESLSGSVKWGHRKNFKDGKVYYHYASFLGYRKGPDGLPEIDPDEAAIVRRIFARYLLGQSVHQICRDLMSDGVKTAQGSDPSRCDRRHERAVPHPDRKGGAGGKHHRRPRRGGWGAVPAGAGGADPQPHGASAGAVPAGRQRRPRLSGL